MPGIIRGKNVFQGGGITHSGGGECNSRSSFKRSFSPFHPGSGFDDTNGGMQTTAAVDMHQVRISAGTTGQNCHYCLIVTSATHHLSLPESPPHCCCHDNRDQLLSQCWSSANMLCLTMPTVATWYSRKLHSPNCLMHPT